jgi:transcriptional regulator with XRE-family HTH domain
MNKFGVAQLEQGRNQPSWETVVTLCKALGVACDEFMKEPQPRQPSGPGRPTKPVEEPAEPEPPKRPRGRPRKPKGDRA